jgi:hypothetical protein
MQRQARLIVYPDGDEQEIERPLSINQLVDLNGNPLPLPLPTARMIVYRVYRISTASRTGEDTTRYSLELVRRDELEELADPHPPER